MAIDKHYRSVLDRLIHDQIKAPKKHLDREIGVMEKKLSTLYRIFKQHYLLNEKEVHLVGEITHIDTFLLKQALNKKRYGNKTWDFKQLVDDELKRREQHNALPWWRRRSSKKPTEDLLAFQAYFQQLADKRKKITIYHCYKAFLHQLNQKIQRRQDFNNQSRIKKWRNFFINRNLNDLLNTRELFVFHQKSRRDLKKPVDRLRLGEEKAVELKEKPFIRRMQRRFSFFWGRRKASKALYHQHQKKCRKAEENIYRTNLNIQRLVNDLYQGSLMRDPLNQKNSAIIQLEIFRGDLHESLFASIERDGLPVFLASRIKRVNEAVEIYDDLKNICDLINRQFNVVAEQEILKNFSGKFNRNNIRLKALKNNPLLAQAPELQGRINNALDAVKEKNIEKLKDNLNEALNFLSNMTYEALQKNDNLEEGFIQNHKKWLCNVSLAELSNQSKKLGKVGPKRAARNVALIDTSFYARDDLANDIVNSLSAYMQYVETDFGRDYFYSTKNNAMRDHEKRGKYLLQAQELLKAGKVLMAANLETFINSGKDYTKENNKSTIQSLGNAVDFIGKYKKLLIDSADDFLACNEKFIKNIERSIQVYEYDLKLLLDKFSKQVRGHGFDEDEVLSAFKKTLAHAEKYGFDNGLGYQLELDDIAGLKPRNKAFINSITKSFVAKHESFVRLVYSSKNAPVQQPLDVIRQAHLIKKRHESDQVWAKGIIHGARHTGQAAKFAGGQASEIIQDAFNWKH